VSISVSIVEDDAGVRSSLAKLIDSSPGYRCLSQHPTAESAMQELPKANPDVILMDINLPGMDGVATLREIRKRWGLLPVIIHTGHTDGQMMIQALEFSPFTLLAKPTDVKKLLATIRGVKRQTDTDHWSKADFQNQTISDHVTL